MDRTTNNEQGYLLLIMVMLLALGGMALSATLHQDVAGAHTVHSSETRTSDYVSAETAIGHTVAWMRQNSQSLVYPFRKENFYTAMERETPAVGPNDSATYTVPTAVKLKGTGNSIMLANYDGFGSVQFPPTINITSNATFDATSKYAGIDLGDSLVRVTLLDAVPEHPDEDFGPPPNDAPKTDFIPIYRIDSMTRQDGGAHVYAMVEGDPVHRYDVGIYGEDYLEIRQPCDSYISADGDYSSGSKRANCPAASNSTATIHQSEAVYGSLRTNGNIEGDKPWGGKTCADFASGCPNEGETCQGEDCGVPLLDEYYPWATYCPQQQAPVTVSGTQTLSINGSNANQRCWQSVKLNSGATLRLTNTEIPYYIKSLDLANNSKFEIAPNPPEGKVELYVESIVGNKFNGNQAVNTTNRPTQFFMHYIGTTPLTLNGNAAMNMALTAPNASVTVSGSFEYKGALLAKQTFLTGSGSIHYDESLGGKGPIVDMQFRLKEMVQFYR